MEILGTVLMHKKKILYTFSALFLIIVLAFTAMYQVANYMQNNISNIEKFIYEKTQITTKRNKRQTKTDKNRQNKDKRKT